MIFENLVEGIWLEEGIPRFKRTLKNEGDGKIRIIYKPNRHMSILHNLFMTHLRACPKFPRFDSARSPAENVGQHLGSRFFYVTDIKYTYPSVRLQKLVRALCLMEPAWGSEKFQLQEFLLRFCMAKEGGLARGAPASPDLWNIYFSFLAGRSLLHNFCQEQKIICTRFADDLTFSSKNMITESQRRTIRRLIGLASLGVNHRKSRVLDIVKGPVVVTGLGLEWRRGLPARIFLPQSYLRKIHGILHLALRGNPDVDPDRIHGLMSVFWSPFWGRGNYLEFHKGSLTSFQKKVLRQYEKYRKSLGLRPSIPDSL